MLKELKGRVPLDSDWTQDYFATTRNITLKG